MIEDNLVEQLAQAVHEQYLAEQIRDGVAMGGRPAMMSWAELDEDKREANRAQVRDIETKLAKYAINPGVVVTHLEQNANGRCSDDRGGR